MQQHEVPIQPERVRVSQMETTTRDDEISLLDLLVIMAENWLWLVLAPLVLGIATYIFLSLQPSNYRVSASVPIPAAEVAALLEGPERQALSPGAEDELAVSTVDGGVASELSMVTSEPDTAREQLSAVIGAIWRDLEAGEITKPEDRYAERIADLEAVVAARANVINRLRETLENGTESDERTYALTALALAQLLVGREGELSRLEEFRAAAAEPVTAPEQPEISVNRLGRSPLLITVLVFFGSGILMLLIILVRHGIKSAAKNPETYRKLGRIKNGLLLRRRAEDAQAE